MAHTVLQVSDLSVKHGNDMVLSDVNFKIEEGEFVFLIGKTGSGKTSLMRTFYADLEVEKGQVQLGNYKLPLQEKRDLPFLRRQVGIVFQDFKLLTDRSVYANLAFVLEATGWTDPEAVKTRIQVVTDLVRLPQSILTAEPLKISGGEQQRVAIARALLNKPSIILADEPTGNLDPIVANAIFDVFEDINREQQTAILMATHNHTFLKRKTARVLFCENGQVSNLSVKEVSNSI